MQGLGCLRRLNLAWVGAGFAIFLSCISQRFLMLRRIEFQRYRRLLLALSFSRLYPSLGAITISWPWLSSSIPVLLGLAPLAGVLRSRLDGCRLTLFSLGKLFAFGLGLAEFSV